MDERLQALRRSVATGEPAAQDELRRALLQTRVEPTWEELAASARWAPMVELLRLWLSHPLAPRDGIGAERIQAREAALGLPLPTVLREWYRLGGGLHGFRGRELPFPLWVDAKRAEAFMPRLEPDHLRFVDAPDARWGVRQDELGAERPPVRFVLQAMDQAPALGPPVAPLGEDFVAGGFCWWLLHDLLGVHTSALARALGRFEGELEAAREVVGARFPRIASAYRARAWQLGHATTPAPLELWGDDGALVLLLPGSRAVLLARTHQGRQRALGLPSFRWEEPLRKSSGTARAWSSRR